MPWSFKPSAMREQRDCARRALRAVEQRGKLMALGIAEIKPFGRH
jgi:hypothetical protein